MTHTALNQRNYAPSKKPKCTPFGSQAATIANRIKRRYQKLEPQQVGYLHLERMTKTLVKISAENGDFTLIGDNSWNEPRQRRLAAALIKRCSNHKPNVERAFGQALDEYIQEYHPEMQVAVIKVSMGNTLEDHHCPRTGRVLDLNKNDMWTYQGNKHTQYVSALRQRLA